MRAALLTIVFAVFASIAPAPAATVHEKDSTGSGDYFIEGVREYCAGDYRTAGDLLALSLEEDPENDAACYYLALIMLSDNDTDKALAFLERASSLDPSNQWYRLTAARIFTGIGENGQAAEILQELIDTDPGKSEYYYELTDILVRNNDLDKALETLGKIEQLRGVSEITANARYEILMRQGRLDEAERAAKVLDTDFPSPHTALLLGDLYKSRYDDSTALQYYRRALEMDPDFTPAYFGIAETCRMRRDFFGFFKNINVFLSSPEMSPTMKADYIQEIIFASGMVPVFRPQVDTLITCTLNAHPSDTAILVLAGSYFAAVDSSDKGMEILRRNIELHPDVRSARSAYMGQLYYRQQWDTLIPVAAETVRLFPDDYPLAELLAVAYWQSGRIQDAIEAYLHILRHLPEGHPMTINCCACLGDLYHEAGNSRKAYSYYEKGLKIDDNYNPILNNYAYFLSEERRNLKKAVEMSRKTVLNEPENSTYLDTYGWLMYLTGEYEEAEKYLKKAMIYGGKESAVILDHYAEALFALKKYNLAFLYWSNADKLDPGLGLSRKIAERREESNRKR